MEFLNAMPDDIRKEIEADMMIGHIKKDKGNENGNFLF